MLKKHLLIIFVLLIAINPLISDEKYELTSIHKTKTIEEFELIGEKAEGTRYPGGTFREISSGTKYLIKYSPLYDSIPEYISGEILSYILGNHRVGRYEYIWDQEKKLEVLGFLHLRLLKTSLNRVVCQQIAQMNLI